MNIEQKHVFDQSIAGHNVVICGQAGTGKTHVLKLIFRAMRDLGKAVSMTASTGIACTQFPRSFRAMTIHRWSGLNDGRQPAERLCELLQSDENYKEQKKRILSSDVLIIDEISMFSAHMLTLLETACRRIRGNDLNFGGLQIIMSGDFYQLPPVPDVLSGDEGKFVFTHEIFTTSFHMNELKTVQRQDQPDLIQAINEVSRGVPSEPTLQLIHRMRRPLPPTDSEQTVHLFATNLQVDTYNMDCLLQESGDIHQYTADDTGDSNILKKLSAPRKLFLKRGCPVMLLRNISDTLVNGSRGKVVDFCEDGPIVSFDREEVTLIIKKRNFSEFDPNKNRVVAERIQIPLKLAYSFTIDKSQGMSLNRVEVDCHLITRPGQLGVAIGRAVSKRGLRIVNYLPRHCIPAPQEVNNLYKSPIMPLVDDLKCCRNLHQVNNNQPIDDFCDDLENRELIESLLSDFTTPPDMPDDNTESVVSLPQEFDVAEMLSAILYKPQITDFHLKANSIIEELKSKTNDLQYFLHHQFKMIKKCAIQPTGETYSQKELSAIFTSINNHQTSDVYLLQCQRLMGVTELSKEHKHVCFRIFVNVREYVIHTIKEERVKAGELAKSLVSRRNPSEDITAGGRGKIRYVAGFCIAKTRYHHQTTMRSLMESVDESRRQQIRIAQTKVILLSNVCMSGPQIHEDTSDPDSLFEIDRKQNLRGSLTYVTDEANTFFSDLCTKIFKLQTIDNLNREGEELHAFILENISRDEELLQKWRELFPLELDLSSANITNEQLMLMIYELYNENTNLFSKVLINQFRKDFLQALRQRKTKALRKSLKDNSSPISLVTVEIPLKNIIHDSSIFPRFKKWLSDENKFPNDLTKDNLKTLCKALGVTYYNRHNKKELQDLVTAGVLNNSSIPHPEHIHQQSTTSTLAAAAISSRTPSPSAVMRSSTAPKSSTVQSLSTIETPWTVPSSSTTPILSGPQISSARRRGRPQKRMYSDAIGDDDPSTVPTDL